ncbi:DNA adenine methylase [Flavobacterium sp.]|uniref:DNA adenine methylase n=1 Tax=Flavobacterium sp. TaxID=239 RepID=UPI004033A7C1
MFSYYGSKSKIVKYYPPPKYGTIIEPFAGSGQYSLMYHDRNVILVDKSPDIIAIWQHLQQCSANDIKALPILPAGSVIDRSMFSCDGEYTLMRYLIVQGAFSGNNTVSPWGAARFENNLARVLRHLHKIKHWQFILGCYTELENTVATWFIDPPYENGGHKYPMSNRKIDFQHLAEWSRTRQGQVIVCENADASWLPFNPLRESKGLKAKPNTEGIWSNEQTNYDNVQMKLAI